MVYLQLPIYLQIKSIYLQYLRAPYGLSSIAEHYNNCRMAEALEGLAGWIVDDIVIYDKDSQQHVLHVK